MRARVGYFSWVVVSFGTEGGGRGTARVRVGGRVIGADKQSCVYACVIFF